jgi:hypothetical protein
VLLIWLLEKNRENSNCRSSSHMSNSHFFLPRSSITGREEKSNCHTLARGTLLAAVGESASADHGNAECEHVPHQLHCQLEAHTCAQCRV